VERNYIFNEQRGRYCKRDGRKRICQRTLASPHVCCGDEDTLRQPGMHQQSFRLGCVSPSRGSRTRWTLVANFKSSECYCHRSNFGIAASKSEQARRFFPTRTSLVAISSYTPSSFLSYRTTPVHISTLCLTILLHSRTLTFSKQREYTRNDYRNISFMNRYCFWTGSQLLWILVPYSFFIGLDLLGWGWERPCPASPGCDYLVPPAPRSVWGIMLKEWPQAIIFGIPLFLQHDIFSHKSGFGPRGMLLTTHV
jgi:hypothetical protein